MQRKGPHDIIVIVTKDCIQYEFLYMYNSQQNVFYRLPNCHNYFKLLYLVYHKFKPDDLKGIKVIRKVNLQCKCSSQMHQDIKFKLS